MPDFGRKIKVYLTSRELRLVIVLPFTPTTMQQTLKTNYSQGQIAGGGTLQYYSGQGPETLSFTVFLFTEAKNKLVDGNDPNRPALILENLRKLIEPIKRSDLPGSPPVVQISLGKADEIKGNYILTSMSPNILLRDRLGAPMHVEVELLFVRYVESPI